MKKLKLLGLLAMMLIVATVLVACGSVANLKKVYNKDFDMNEKLFTKSEKISELEGFEPIEALSNDDFVAFAKPDEDGSIETKVYSFRKGEVVKSMITNEEDIYLVSFLSGAPVFCVQKTDVATEEGAEDEVTRTYYDANGDEMQSVKAEYEVAEPMVVTEKLVIINAMIYNIDEVTGAATEKGALPAYVSYEKLAHTDEYFYTEDDGAIVIYDLDFAPVAIYSAPSYAEWFDEEALNWNILNNGDVLVQYYVELDEDAKKFDFYEYYAKYDLVSLIVTAKGDVKNLDLDYIVDHVATNDILYDDTKEKEENLYTNKFENIAYIYRIENQKIDFSDVNKDIVLMNNSGKAQKSLKLVDGQIGMPVKVAEDLYAAQTVYGTALLNGKGKLQFAVTADEDIVAILGGFIVTEKAIYDMKFELVEDGDIFANDGVLYAEDPEDACFANTVFVKIGDDKKYDIVAYNAEFEGGKKTIYSYNEENEENDTFELFDGIGYVITDGDGNRIYYNVKGAELLNTTAKAEIVADNGDDKIIVKLAEKDATNYYVLTQTAEDAE